jgi:enamine deaminase RidA (YjgF/YER057c/UK114 family)
MTRMKLKIGTALAALMLGVVSGAGAQMVVKHLQPNEKAVIADGVWAGDTLYLSGQLASPATPADAAAGKPAVYGDTKAQPNKPARSAVQVAALAAPWALVEIEVIAVKSK